MDSAANIALSAYVILGSPVALGAYGWVGWRIATGGGKVPVKYFGMGDLLAGGLLALMLVYLCFSPPAKEIHTPDLIANATFWLTIVTALCSFMFFRKFNLVEQFGLRAMNPFKAAAFAIGLLFVAYPLLLGSELVLQIILEKSHAPEPKPQELIQFFSDAAHKNDHRAVAWMFLTAMLVAPLTEEMIFRGYLYGIMKRYIGVTAGVILNSALFACVHQSPSSLPGLFLLAVCLTLAYEFTGSILVNMGMHSLFNFCSLMYAYYHLLPPAQ